MEVLTSILEGGDVVPHTPTEVMQRWRRPDRKLTTPRFARLADTRTKILLVLPTSCRCSYSTSITVHDRQGPVSRVMGETLSRSIQAPKSATVLPQQNGGDSMFVRICTICTTVILREQPLRASSSSSTCNTRLLLEYTALWLVISQP